MTEKHIADAEASFYVLNVPPDFCVVGESIIPFDIAQVLKPELQAYAQTVFARDEKVLLVKSVINGVMGNAGAGVGSKVSLGVGHSLIPESAATVFIEDRQVARHLDKVYMNCQVD